MFLDNARSIKLKGQVDLQRLLTSSSFTYKDSTITLLPNLRLSNKISLSKIDNTGKFIPIQNLSGLIGIYYNDILDNQYEKICDISNNDGEVASTDYYIILISYLTGDLAEYDLSIKTGFKIALEILNKENPILNRYTHPLFVDANTNDLNDEIINYLNHFNVLAIFNSMEFTDFEVFITNTNETIFKIPLFYINLIPNEIYSSNYFLSGMNIGTLWRETKTSLNPKNIFFIGSKGIISANTIKYISYDCSLNGINIRGSYILDSNTYEHAVNACNEIEADCKLYGDCIVITFMERNYTRRFYEQYKKVNLLYPIVSYNLDELMINSVDKTIVYYII